MRWLDEIPAYIWRASSDGIYDLFNRLWREFTGMERCAGSDAWLEKVHPDDREHIRAEHQQRFAERQPFEIVYRLRDAQGRYRWLHEIGTVLTDAKGKLVGFQGHATDFTDWKQAEELLHASEIRAQALAEMSPVGIFRKDTAGNCLYTNQRCSELTQMSPKDAKGKGWTLSVHQEDKEAFVNEWSRFAHTGTAFNLQYRVCREDGNYIWVQGQAKPERDSDGEIVGCV
ncbi:MAG: PAS domain S-box-containing protein [Verrucomicrobiales bacterium]